MGAGDDGARETRAMPRSRSRRWGARAVVTMVTLAVTVTMGAVSGARAESAVGEGSVAMRARDLEGYLAQAPMGATIGVKFYAPWCGHCKLMAPAWEEFAREGTEGGYVALSVDASGDEAKEVNAKFNIKGFPTLFFFSGGKVFEYSGARTAEAFRAFARGARDGAHSRKYAVDSNTNKIVFHAPSVMYRLRELVRDVARDFTRVFSAKPAVCVSIFLFGLWLGMFSVVATFFLAGDYAAAKNWREFMHRNAEKIKASSKLENDPKAA